MVVYADIRVACSPGEARVAVTDGRTLLDYALWRPAAPEGVGEVHLGRVTACRPEMGGAFVALAGHEPGFLPEQDGASPLNEGTSIVVTITRAAMGGKGPRLKRVEGEDVAAGGSVPRLLKVAPSAVERFARAWPNAAIIIDGPSFAARLPVHLRDRVQRVQSAFPDEVQDAVEKLSDVEIDLPGGMRASITPTPALVAVDMDSGEALSGGQTKQRAQYAANRDALPALLHQIRLRNLSGAILIDPAGLSTRKRQALKVPVEEALALDPLKPRLLSVTALGLLEIVRSRTAPPLHELRESPHGRALAALGAVLVAARPGTRLCLKCSPDVFRALETDKEAVEEARLACGAILQVKLDPALTGSRWEISDE
ncbi:MAG: ribonuclease E/G [Acetobacter sp.]|nr:ribonuclease E/G [Acetobacter sp.]